MKQGSSPLARAAMSLLLFSSSSGCSFIFVDTPPSTAHDDGQPASIMAPVTCTSSRLAPGFDTVFGALQLVRTGMAAAASDNVYNDPNAPLSREADIALGVGFATLFISSAVYGFVNTSRCSRLKNGETNDAPAPPDPPETWSASARETRPVRATPVAAPPETSEETSAASPAPPTEPPSESEPPPSHVEGVP